MPIERCVGRRQYQPEGSWGEGPSQGGAMEEKVCYRGPVTPAQGTALIKGKLRAAFNTLHRKEATGDQRRLDAFPKVTQRALQEVPKSTSAFCWEGVRIRGLAAAAESRRSKRAFLSPLASGWSPGTTKLRLPHLSGAISRPNKGARENSALPPGLWEGPSGQSLGQYCRKFWDERGISSCTHC